MRLIVIMIGVLPQQQHIDAFIRRYLQCRENLRLRRKNGIVLALFIYELREFVKVRLFKLTIQMLMPALRDVYLAKSVL